MPELAREVRAGDIELSNGTSTALLWEKRAHGPRSIAYAAALSGVDTVALRSSAAIGLAASDEANALLDHMEFLFRTLTTTVATESERCVLSVRGPVLWSETITARANALGNEDVFVCGTSSRSFDTVENRILVEALEAIGAASKVLRDPDLELSVSTDTRDRAEAAALSAKRWRNGPRLCEVPTRRLTGRDLARMNGSRRLARMATVLAVRDRKNEPFVADDIVAMTDEWTCAYHDFVIWALEEIGGLTRLPRTMTCFEGGIWAGPVSFRHPVAGGAAPTGLAIRGIPLLPPASVIDGAPWQAELPAGGVTISSRRDIERIVGRIGGAAATGAPQRPL